MHTPASALPGSALLLQDAAGQRLAQQAFSPRAGGAFPPGPEFEGAFVAPGAFLNSWVNLAGGFALAGYYKDRSGVVHLHGLLTAGVIGSTAFVLPVGFRPALIEIFACATNGTFGRFDVQDDGQVIAKIGANGFMSLCGITFRAA